MHIFPVLEEWSYNFLANNVIAVKRRLNTCLPGNLTRLRGSWVEPLLGEECDREQQRQRQTSAVTRRVIISQCICGV